MHSLAETAFQSRGERNAVFTELVANMIHGCQRFSPTISLVFHQEVELTLFWYQSGCVHAQQPDFGFGFAILAEQGACLPEDFGIQLGGMVERMGARDGGKIRIA